MALHRQGSGSWQVRMPSFGTAFRIQDHVNGDQKFLIGGRQGTSSKWIEVPNKNGMKSGRIKRLGRTSRGRQYGVGLFAIVLLCLVTFTFLGGNFLFSVGRMRRAGGRSRYRSHNSFDHSDHSIFFSLWNLGLGNGDSILKDNATLPCEIAFLNTTRGLKEPDNNPKFARFSLKYVEREERPEGDTHWEPRFAGHQTLEEREESFKAKDQTIHCGFVQGPDGSPSTGFDLSEEDKSALSVCRIAVSSCIFANSDNIHPPRGKKLTGSFKKDVCFVMFMDQRSLNVMIEEGQGPDERGYYGLWKVVIVGNLPYADARRNGKVPKFLTHRLFPAARYSIWLDSKLRLQSDSVLILEYLLWRGEFEYAISNHYERHCVWEEVRQNKRLNKFNHSVIDHQFAFYRADGLMKFNESDPNKLLPSYVPEGSFIARAHTPMSNLFSCLWFNEVDRFTPRDQLSFAYTYFKVVRMNPQSWFYLNMFEDCERKTMAKLFRHRRNVTSQ